MEDESPRRMPPKMVVPLSHNGIRYEVILRAHLRGFKQSGGILAAVNEKTGQEIWIAQIYQTRYDGDEEKDVQEVYISKIEVLTDGLQITNERGQRYYVDFDGKNISKIN